MAVCMTPRMGTRRGKIPFCPAASQFLSGVGELALRISGPGQGSRLVRIHSAKCTVGSAQGCTLRLVARGVAAIECWILRGEGGMVIRRFGGAVHLNGAHFDEAVLMAGDRLTVGPLEILVEACGSATVVDEPAPRSTSERTSDVLNMEARLNRALEQIRQLQGESRQGFESSITAADRADQMRDALEATNEQLEEVCEELAAAQATIEQQARELTAAQETSERQAAELAAAHEEREQHIHGKQSAEAELCELNEKIAAANKTINRLSNELSEEREKSAAILNAQTGSAEAITALEAQLAAKSAEIAAISQQHTTSEELERKLSELRQQLEHRQAESALSQQRATAAEAEAAMLRQKLQERAELQTRTEALAAELSLRNGELEEVRQAVTILSSQLASAGQIESDKKAIERQLTVLAERERQFEDSMRRFEEKQAALAAEEEQLARAQQNLAAKERELSDAAAEIAKTQQAILIQQGHNIQAEAELQTLRQTLQAQAELQTRMDLLATELAVKSRELDAARQAVADLTSQLAHAGQINEDKAAIERQQAVLADRESQLAESIRSSGEKQAALAAEAEQLLLVKQRLTDKEQQLTDAAAQIEQAQQAILGQQRCGSDLNQRFSEMESRATDIAARMAELDRLLERLVDERASLTGREQEICRREQDFEERWGQLNRQAEQFQARRDQLDEREAQLQDQEAAAANRATEVSLRHTSADVMQTTCHESLRLDEDTGMKCDDVCGEEPHRTIVASREVSGDAPQLSESPDINCVLGQLDRGGVWRESEQSEQPAMTEPAPAPPRFVAATHDIAPPALRAAHQPASGDNDESIESYMERLMQRVRGDAGPGQTDVSQSGVTQTAMKPKTSSFAAPPAEDVGSTMVGAFIPEGSAEGEATAAEEAQRRPAPDFTANLTAMRELANSAANAAIDLHVRNKDRSRANRKLLGACLALGGSVVLSLVSWEAASLPGMAGAVAGCSIAAYWMLGAAQGFIRLKSRKQQI